MERRVLKAAFAEQLLSDARRDRDAAASGEDGAREFAESQGILGGMRCADDEASNFRHPEAAHNPRIGQFGMKFIF